MKKSLFALLIVFAISGCSSSDSTPLVTPVYKDTLNFVENSTPYGALIFEDATTLSEVSTAFHFALENLTPNTYHNVTFTVDPADSTKYSISADESCKTLSYTTDCGISIHVNTKVEGDINFKIKMNSDRGELTFTPKTIKANYKIQPNVNTLSFSGESKTFLVVNATPYTSILKGDYIDEKTIATDTRSLEFAFQDGMKGFEIIKSDTTKSFTANGKTYNFKNCFALSSQTLIDNMANSDASACYVEMNFTNTHPGTHSDVLTIKPAPLADGSSLPWKVATIALSATVNMQ